MICIYSNSVVYVACPANHATGGTELLHQLVSRLNKLSIPSRIYYYDTHLYKDSNYEHPLFKKYLCKHVTSVPDVEEAILIVPEMKTELLLNFKKVKKIIWWLSVDNYYWKPRRIRLARLFGFYKDVNIKKHKKYNIHTHLVQSFYAKDHLYKNEIFNVEYLSDYLNEAFFEKKIEPALKENLVLYNPLKGFHFTKAIIEQSPEINWMAIQNMTPAEVSELMLRSKVYIDFGHHPGMDRFPREAAVSGCCIITGLKGSAAFFEDVSIPDEFKFKNNKAAIPGIIATIKSCLNNYESEILKFDNYRQKIKKQEENFEKDINRIFQKCDD